MMRTETSVSTTMSAGSEASLVIVIDADDDAGEPDGDACGAEERPGSMTDDLESEECSCAE